MRNMYVFNTLLYEPTRCIGCGICSTVCPHAVFAQSNHIAELAHPEACMECGACQQNCPTAAISVESGVGCAAAMIRAVLTGKAPSCGCEGGSAGCCA